MADTKQISKCHSGLLPTPGSPAALADGCRCPATENHDGRGWIEAAHSPDGTFHPPVYIFVAECPVHDPQETK